jgi:HEAT repeat protein
VPRDRLPAMTNSIRSLVDRLYSADPKARAEAACELGRRPTSAEPAIPVLLSMLGDDAIVPAIECEMSPWMRRQLPNNPDAQKWMQTSPAKEAAEALGDIGNLAVPGLLQALASSDWKVRKFAAVAFGEMDHIIDLGTVIDALGRTLADANVDVRDQSAWALGEIEEPASVDLLVRALRDADARIRVRAAWALGEIEDASAVEGLLDALRDSDPAVRERSIWALGEIESERAVDGLLPLLGDADAKVRRQAAWALGEIEDPSALDDLRAAANDPNAEVRRAVAQALRELGDRRRR